ncbi:hypothetical protein DFH08DRAFT_820299 [Mycena albidolilacea]|uniref:Uncharacterized protein n=1 Tax=Mycena albidolilacea TaxID=1033008 RepID=A0AAD7EEQ6_9AGAR|nr:hypothetical protein DFH08DRAFT_820299 [Mycena albidolilacea]
MYGGTYVRYTYREPPAYVPSSPYVYGYGVRIKPYFGNAPELCRVNPTDINHAAIPHLLICRPDVGRILYRAVYALDLDGPQSTSTVSIFKMSLRSMRNLILKRNLTMAVASYIRDSGNGTGRHYSASATSGCQRDLHWIPVANHTVLDPHRHPTSSTAFQWTYLWVEIITNLLKLSIAPNDTAETRKGETRKACSVAMQGPRLSAMQCCGQDIGRDDMSEEINRYETDTTTCGGTQWNTVEVGE